MALSIAQNIHVTITVNGSPVDFDLAPGDEVPTVLEDLLVAQGLTTDATAKKPTKSTTPDPILQEA